MVKRLVVNPGGTLSLQKHEFRSEVWTIASGVAEVTVGPEVTIKADGDIVRIPMFAVHRLKNIGGVALEVIEVQFGQVLSEDDIVRIEDAYGRV